MNFFIKTMSLQFIFFVGLLYPMHKEVDVVVLNYGAGNGTLEDVINNLDDQQKNAPFSITVKQVMYDSGNAYTDMKTNQAMSYSYEQNTMITIVSMIAERKSWLYGLGIIAIVYFVYKRYKGKFESKKT